MGKKENRPDACAASGTANSIYKDFSTDAPDIQGELTGPVLPDECAADIVSFCSEQTIAYDDLLEYLHKMLTKKAPSQGAAPARNGAPVASDSGGTSAPDGREPMPVSGYGEGM